MGDLTDKIAEVAVHDTWGKPLGLLGASTKDSMENEQGWMDLISTDISTFSSSLESIQQMIHELKKPQNLAGENFAKALDVLTKYTAELSKIQPALQVLYDGHHSLYDAIDSQENFVLPDFATTKLHAQRLAKGTLDYKNFVNDAIMHYSFFGQSFKDTKDTTATIVRENVEKILGLRIDPNVPQLSDGSRFYTTSGGIVIEYRKYPKGYDPADWDYDYLAMWKSYYAQCDPGQLPTPLQFPDPNDFPGTDTDSINMRLIGNAAKMLGETYSYGDGHTKGKWGTPNHLNDPHHDCSSSVGQAASQTIGQGITTNTQGMVGGKGSANPNYAHIDPGSHWENLKPGDIVVLDDESGRGRVNSGPNNPYYHSHTMIYLGNNLWMEDHDDGQPYKISYYKPNAQLHAHPHDSDYHKAINDYNKAINNRDPVFLRLQPQ